MKTKTILLLALSLVPFLLNAQALGFNNNRIACSADGNNQPDLNYTGTYNTADPDDWGATPMALAILAKARLQDKLVHYSYNNFMPSPPHTTETNFMKINAEGAAERFQFKKEVFFDVGTQKTEALVSLKNELMKSTASDPLYFIHMGPSEFFYQAVDSVVKAGGIESLSHVYVISHSNYNDTHLRRPTEHTMPQAIALSGNRINYKRIKDQNTCDVGYQGLCSNQNAYPWRNFKDHRDPNLRWIYERMQDHKHGKYDVSDAGMVYYLLKNNENASPSALDNYFDYGILLPGEEIFRSINIDASSVTIFPQRGLQLGYTTNPAQPWDNFMTWKTSNAEVAYVSPNGKVIGVSPGSATITVTAGIENKTDQITVHVADTSYCEECSENCELTEKDGLLVFEAERFNLKGKWKVVEGDNYASGGKYITYYGANSYNNVNTAHEISYTFHINNPGTYNVRWFMRQPDDAEGDKSNDVWIYIDGNYGYGGSEQLTKHEKFVGRSKTVFTMNGGLDLHGSSPSLTAKFPSAGDYTLKIAGRSEHIQIDKIVFYKGLSGNDAIFKASNVTETTTCMDDEIDGQYPFEPLNAISLSSTTIDMYVGESMEPDIIYTPTNATNKVVTLTSQTPNVISIEGKTIKAIGAGTGQVLIESVEGNYSATLNVNVSIKTTAPADLNQNKLEIFPNPINEKCTIRSAHSGTMEIISLDGRVVLKAQIATGTNTIHLRNIKPGNYIAHFISEVGSKQSIITVER